MNKENLKIAETRMNTAFQGGGGSFCKLNQGFWTHRNRFSAFTMADRRSRSQSDIHLLGYLPAFTMAEILISLTIIGIIAAITLPSLRANINEMTWSAQRKALYSRLNQAIAMMPSVNGYGEYEGSWSDNSVNVSKDTAALAFVTDGLGKVLKIKNICDSTQLKKCGMPDKYQTWEGKKYNLATKLSEFNSNFVKVQSGYLSNYNNPLKYVDTAAAGFETTNGESVAVYYNPACVGKDVELIQSGTVWGDAKNIFPYFCAAFKFDLNGKKGPNKNGKDIWTIIVLYSSDSEVVMVPPEKLSNVKANLNYDNSAQYCSSKDARLPNVNEGVFLKLLNFSGTWVSGNTGYSDKAYFVTSSGSLIKLDKNYASSTNARCIKR